MEAAPGGGALAPGETTTQTEHMEEEMRVNMRQDIARETTSGTPNGDEDDLEDVEVLSYLGRRELCDVRQVEGLSQMRGLRRLTIHGCDLRSLVGLPGTSALPLLEELNLSGNTLTSVEGLPELPSLRMINISSNRITTLRHMPRLERLERLVLAHNMLTELDFAGTFMRASGRVSHIDARDNALDSLSALAALVHMTALRNLRLSGPDDGRTERNTGNGVVAKLGETVSDRLGALLPQLTMLDGETLTRHTHASTASTRAQHEAETSKMPHALVQEPERTNRGDEDDVVAAPPSVNSGEGASKPPLSSPSRTAAPPADASTASAAVENDASVRDAGIQTDTDVSSRVDDTDSGDEALRADNADMRAELEDLHSKMRPLLNEVKTQVQMRKREVERADRAERELKRLQADAVDRERVLEGAWKKATDTLKVDADTLRGKNASYEEMNRALQQETWRLRHSMQTMQQHGNAQLAALNDELTRTRTALKESNQERALMAQTLEQSSRAAELLRVQVDESRVAASNAQHVLQREIARQASELEKAKSAEKRARDEGAELRAELERVQSVASQKIESMVLNATSETSNAVLSAKAAMQAEFKAALDEERRSAARILDEKVAQMDIAHEKVAAENTTVTEEATSLRAELTDVRDALEQSVSRGKQAEQLVQELSDVVRAQKAKIHGLQSEAERSERGTHQLAHLQARLAQAEERCTISAGIERENVRLRDDLCESKTKIALLQQELLSLREAMSNDEMPSMRARLEHLQDALRVKEMELQSAMERDTRLQSQVKDVRDACAKELQRATEMIEDERRASKDIKDECAEYALLNEKISVDLEEAKLKLQEVESSERDAHKSLASSQSLLKYVEEEVHNLRSLFSEKEAHLQAEVDSARARVDELRSETSELRARLSAADGLAREEREVLEHRIRSADSARSEAIAQRVEAEKRLASVEDEMRVLLSETQRRKQESSEKVRYMYSTHVLVQSDVLVIAALFTRRRDKLLVHIRSDTTHTQKCSTWRKKEYFDFGREDMEKSAHEF